MLGAHGIEGDRYKWKILSFTTVWHLDAGPATRVTGAGLAVMEDSLTLLVGQAGRRAGTFTGIARYANTVLKHHVVWAVASFNTGGLTLGVSLDMSVVLSETGAGGWAGGTAGLVDHTAGTGHWAEVSSPPSDVDTLGVTGVGVGSDHGAHAFAVTSSVITGTGIHNTGIVVAGNFDSSVALSEEGSVKDFALGPGPVFLFSVHFAGRDCWDERFPGTSFSSSPGVGEGDGFGFHLTGTGTEVIVGTGVVVAAKTADMRAVLWLEGDVHTHGTVPLDGEAMSALDVGVDSSIDDFIFCFV